MKRLIRTDDGLTLTELMVALFLLVVVSAVFLPSLISGMRATTQISNVARSNDDARLTLQRIDREIRAAEQICNPTPGNASDSLRFITRAYTSVSTATGTQDITYQINGTDLEKSRDNGTTWEPVVGGVVNASVVDDQYNAQVGRALGTVGVPLFTTQGLSVSSTTSTSVVALPSYGKVVTVRLWVDESATDNISPIMLTTELSGRNIWTPNGPGCSP